MPLIRQLINCSNSSLALSGGPCLVVVLMGVGVVGTNCPTCAVYVSPTSTTTNSAATDPCNGQFDVCCRC